MRMILISIAAVLAGLLAPLLTPPLAPPANSPASTRHVSRETRAATGLPRFPIVEDSPSSSFGDTGTSSGPASWDASGAVGRTPQIEATNPLGVRADSAHSRTLNTTTLLMLIALSVSTDSGNP